MSLSELSNPKAAAELLARVRKKFGTKVCLAPMADHVLPIVSAHTLSLESMLRRIAVDGHVYTYGQAKSFSKDTLPIEFQRKGLRDVSVFNGFCSKHDRELFACLETEPFAFRRDQLFMLAYRAAARESYLKRKQLESFPTAEELVAIHRVEGEVEQSPTAALFLEACCRGAEEVEALKEKLDKLLLQRAWDRLVTRAILFAGTPTVLASGAFQPFYDVEGTMLQDGEDLVAEMSPLFFSLIPIAGEGGAAIFSWQDVSNAAPRRFFEAVARGKDMTAAVLQVALDYIENVAFAPAWFEALGPEQETYLMSRVMRLDGGPTGSMGARADELAPYLATWGSATIASF